MLGSGLGSGEMLQQSLPSRSCPSCSPKPCSHLGAPGRVTCAAQRREKLQWGRGTAGEPSQEAPELQLRQGVFRSKPGRERLLGQGTSLQADARAEGSMASSGNRVTFCGVGKMGLLCEIVLSLSLPRIIPNIVMYDITGQNMFPFVFFHKSFEDVYCAASALKTDFVRDCAL